MKRRWQDKGYTIATMKYSPCLAIIDFDGVLFNDMRFKQEYETLFQCAGISRVTYEKTYQQTKKKGYYDPRIHIRLALGSGKGASVTEKSLFSQIKTFLDQSFRFVYGDVKKFLAFLKEEGINAILLSTGDAVFQKHKLAKSGIHDFFNDVIIIPHASKIADVDMILRKMKPMSAIFIDDKREVVEAIKNSLPSVYAIHMRRRDNEMPSRNADLVARSFADMTMFIKEWRARHNE